jgi:hypothetical protein
MRTQGHHRGGIVCDQSPQRIHGQKELLASGCFSQALYVYHLCLLGELCGEIYRSSRDHLHRRIRPSGQV